MTDEPEDAVVAWRGRAERSAEALAVVQQVARDAMSSSVFPSRALARIDALCDDALWTRASSPRREGDVF
jgi:hypothetical protein